MSKRRRAAQRGMPRVVDGRSTVSRGGPRPLGEPATSHAASARWPILVSGAAGFLALLLYVATLAPTVATGDSGELSTVAASLGLAHPPGYPTFTVLGYLFTLLPFGDPAFRVNLLSAVLDGLAVAAFVLVTGRFLSWLRDGQDESGDVRSSNRAIWLVAGLAGLALATSTAFWRYSLVAEVFALSNLLAILVLGLMLEWSRRPDRFRLLWAAGLTAGLAIANQQTIVFAAPGLIVLLGLGITAYTAEAPRLPGGRPFPWRQVAVAVGLGVVGLLPYMYLPLAAARGAETIWGDPTSLDGFLGIVARSAYGTFSFTVRDTSGSALEHVGLFVTYLWTAYTPIGVVLLVVGGGWLAVRRTGEAIGLGLWILFAGPVFLTLANPPLADPVTRGVLERFYLLPSLPIALLIGVGAWLVVRWLGRRVVLPPGRQVAAAAVLPILFIGLAIVVWIRLPEVDASDNQVAARYAEDLLQPLPDNAVLLMRSDENYTAVTYAQQVRGLRTDVAAIDVELLKLPTYVDVVEMRHADIDIPFVQYDGGVRTSIVDLVASVMRERPVFLVGTLEEDIGSRLDILDAGLVDRILPNGDAPDPLAGLRDDPGIWSRLHPPDRAYPETTWEAAIAANYADAAFDIGVALQQLGPQSNVDAVESMYRAAIRISPTLASAYKNLGLLLQTNGGAPEEIIPIWERYLELRPDDPEASAIRAAIERLRSGASGPPGGAFPSS